MLKIILGSASKARQQILKDLGFDFDVKVSNIDEKAIRIDDPYQLPLLLAQAKSEKLQSQITEPVILITSDEIVLHDGHVLEKPENEAQAKEFLLGYGTRPVEVVTAVFVVNTQTHKSAQGTEIGIVYFHKIPETVIDELIVHGGIMNAAGGFIAEMPAIKKYIIHVEGGMDTVMGLPKLLTKKLIDQVS